MDADLATPPEESLKLLTHLREGAPVAAGSRIQPDGSDMRASQPAQRRSSASSSRSCARPYASLPDIDDTQCPMKGFAHDAAHAIFERQRLSGWIFDAEVLYIARALGYPVGRSARRLGPRRRLPPPPPPPPSLGSPPRPHPPPHLPRHPLMRQCLGAATLQ